MSEHRLMGRRDEELAWYRRRGFLQAAAAWGAGGGFGGALAQARSNVVEQRGDILVNGRPLLSGQSIQSGDTVQSGPGARLVFVVGSSSFLVRENSYLSVERGNSLFTISLLRLVSGAVASVWGRGARRQIVTPTLTAGIRGTGVYTEVFKAQSDRTYFCNCYGQVELAAGPDTVLSQAQYHQSFWAEPQALNGRLLTPAQAINHTDEEIEQLARLVDQRTAWQILGRPGVKDGRGYMESGPNTYHPAAPSR